VLDVLEVGVVEVGHERKGVQGTASRLQSSQARAVKSMPMRAPSGPVKGRGKRACEGEDFSVSSRKQKPKRPPSKHITPSSATNTLSGWLSHSRRPMSACTCKCWPARQPVTACRMWICEEMRSVKW
jgi:hypothetical protein